MIDDIGSRMLEGRLARMEEAIPRMPSVTHQGYANQMLEEYGLDAAEKYVRSMGGRMGLLSRIAGSGRRMIDDIGSRMPEGRLARMEEAIPRLPRALQGPANQVLEEYGLDAAEKFVRSMGGRI